MSFPQMPQNPRSLGPQLPNKPVVGGRTASKGEKQEVVVTWQSFPLPEVVKSILIC